MDDSSNSKQCGARVALESPGWLKVEQSLHFNFKASDNQAEYEALIVGLNLTGDMRVKQLRCLTDSQLMVGQINDTFQVKDPLLTRYYQKVSTLLSKFQHAEIQYVPKSKNGRADALYKLALGKKKDRFDTVIQLILSSPTVSEEDCMNIEMTEDWRSPIIQTLKTLLMGKAVADKVLAKKAARYVLIIDDLYKRGFTTPLLECLGKEQSEYVMNELHNDICGIYSGHKTLAARVIRAGYYWPTVRQNCAEYVKKCRSCQENGPLIHQPPTNLQTISASWPFAKWGMNILGPFPPATGQRRFLIVAVDYFTKWIEAEPLAKITAAHVQNFMWKLICRFDIPHTVITDNGRQFVDQKLEAFFTELGVKHITSSMEHPQTNGQAEAANKVVLSQLKKRLGAAKGKWADKLLEVLWAYRCTLQTSTGESPYNLTYGMDAMLLVEIGEATIKRQLRDLSLNNECMKPS